VRANIYINGTLVDVNDDVNLSFTYTIADIREPEARQASYSKTITLPASKTNNDLFTQVYEVNKRVITGGLNFDNDFNPNKKATAIVTVDDVIIMQGYMQMLKINKSNGYAISYEVIIISETKNIIDEFKDDKLCKVDFSEYDHGYNPQIIEASWRDYVVKDGNQYNNFIGNQPTGEGYIYLTNCKYYKNATVTNGISQNDIPAIYLKTIIDAIFKDYGYTYQSTFFNSDYFKKLIVPASKYSQVLNESEIQSLTFNVINSDIINNRFVNTIATYQTRVTIFRDDVLNTEQVYQRPLNYYIPNAPYIGTITANIDFNPLIIVSDNDKTIDDHDLQVTIRHRLMMKVAGTFIEADSTNTLFNLQLLYPNPTNSNLNFATKSAVTKFTHQLTYTGSIGVANEFYVETGVLLGGELYDGATPKNWYLTLDYVGNSTGTSYTTEFFNEPDNSTLAQSATVSLGRFINQDISVRDFFISVIKLFNLYIEPDKQNINNFFIEPYQSYYDRLNKVDWTGKLDVTDFQIIPTSGLDIRNYQFKFIDDTDVLNKAYKEKHIETYGDYVYTNNNTDFANNEKLIQPMFAPTPLCTQYSLTNYENIFFDEKETERNLKLRLLIYGGVRNDGGGNYCYAGEVDDPMNPTEAIRYDQSPAELYYYTNLLTNSTLFNKFWFAYVQEMTDINSRMIIAKLKLTPLDISTFRFNSEIFIESEYFRVNRIVDYNPLQEGLTKVELIKVNYSNGYTAKTYRSVGSYQSFNVVEGSEDEVRDSGAISFYNILEGGENEIRDIGAITNIGIVNGGQNTV
jgi:hypothetical protein